MSMKTGTTSRSREHSGYEYADTHCHLVPDWFTLEEISKIAIKAQQSGIKTIINSVLKSENYSFGLKTIKNKGIHLTIGTEITDNSQESIQMLKEFYTSNQESIVAIGEIGLDFYWVKEEEKRSDQEKYFKQLIQFSIAHDIPIVVHSRGAESKAIEILKATGAENVLMHCFEGTAEQINDVMRRAWYISVPTSTVYRKNFQKVLQLVSLDNLMFETDSPFHSLEKEENNTPLSIPTLCRNGARILEVEEKELAYITTKNVKDFYRL
ncbi:MAG: TatD family hydrolase [Asgard group archaeon]|nr:TatD family hydrolase [Asgard group archaeon]